jgi:hypothetical protein
MSTPRPGQDPKYSECGERIWHDINYAAIAWRSADYPDTHVEFEVYEITGMAFTDSAGVSHPPSFDVNEELAATEDMREADVFLHGSVKWDGCSNWMFDEQDRCMLHFCEKESAANIGVLFTRLYEWAKELGMDRL